MARGWAPTSVCRARPRPSALVFGRAGQNLAVFEVWPPIVT